jgi:hypothetical protein
MVSTVYSKGLYSLVETTQILFGPCKRKGSEYQRVNRMVKAGSIDSIADGERRYISRKVLLDYLGSEEKLDKAMQNLSNIVELYPSN